MAEETKETKKIIPESKKKHKKKHKKKKVLLKVSDCLFVVGRNRLVYFWGKGYEA